MKKMTAIALAFALLLSLAPTVARAGGLVTNEAMLLAAIDEAEADDTINIGADITVSDEVVIAQNLTIQGGGHTISVARPGVTESGVLSDAPSTYRVFNITGGTIRMENLTIFGGAAEGGGVFVASDATVSLYEVNISRSGGIDTESGDAYYPGDSFPGGGICVESGGAAYIDRCNISRNAASFGGGFLNSGYMVITNSSFTENRSIQDGCGGGAVENKGTLFINNCTFSNNKSTELGGAINDIGGTAYILNSTFTGNVAYSYGTNGGALRGNDSTLLHNCVFAYNYTNNPLVLNDSAEYSGAITAYNSLLHGTTPWEGRLHLSQYGGTADGENDSLFAGGALTNVLYPDGQEIENSAVFQPFLQEVDGLPVAALHTDYTMPAALRTLFYPDEAEPVIAFWDDSGEQWVQLTYSAGTWTETALDGPENYTQHEVTTDQLGDTRVDGGVIGSANYRAANLYMLKLRYDPATAHGQVNGLSVYGDVYPSGAEVTVTATADANYLFDRWMKADDTEHSTDNPLTITVTEDLTLYPLYLFAAPSVGSIAAPVWRENGAASLELPARQDGITETTAEGWQISDDGTSGWTAFTPPDTATMSHNEKYLRYYMTNSHCTAYSNVVQILVIGENARMVTVEMRDRFGDSWSDCALKIVVNETPLAPNATIASGATATYQFAVNPEDEVDFYWVAGKWQEETAFAVYYSSAPPAPAFDPTSGGHATCGGAILLCQHYGTSPADGALLDTVSVMPYTVVVNGHSQGTDSVTAQTVHKNAGDTVSIDYTLSGGAIVNSLDLGNGIETITTPGTDTAAYEVDPSHADEDGIITLTPVFTHENILDTAAIAVTAPVKGGTPQDAVVAGAYYTGGIVWSGGLTGDGKFAGGGTYVATVTLTATNGATFDSGFSPTATHGTVGNVAVALGGGSVTFTVSFDPLPARAAVSIAVTTNPAKTTYWSGETLDLDGITVTATYDDGTTGDVTATEYKIGTETVTEATVLKNAAHGGKPITVLYGELSGTTGNLTVNLLTVRLGTVTGDESGDSVTLTTVQKDHGETVSIGYTLADLAIADEIRFTPNTIALTSATEATYKVRLADATAGVVEITAEFKHNSTLYSANVSVTPPGKNRAPQGAIDTVSADYYTAGITWSPADSPFNANTVYTAEITLTASGVGAQFAPSFALSVNGLAAERVSHTSDEVVFRYTFPMTADKVVNSIALRQAPRLHYNVGEKLDLSALEVAVNYDTGVEALTLADLARAMFAIADRGAVQNGATLYAAQDGKELSMTYGGETLSLGSLAMYTPPTIKLWVTDIAETSATLHFSTTAGMGTLRDEGGTQIATGSGTVSTALTPLSEDTEYFFELTVEDSGHTFTRSIRFCTLAPSGITVGGNVTDSSNPAQIIVNIERGNTVVASVTAMRDDDYAFAFNFDKIPDGVYNFVADNGSYKVTHAVRIEGDSIDDIDINMDSGKTQSIVEIKREETPPAAVDGLPDLFGVEEIYTPTDIAVVTGKGTVEIKLVAEKQDSPDDADAIQSAAGGKSVGLFIDLSVIKSHFTEAGVLTHEEPLSDLGVLNLLTISFDLPASMTGRQVTTIYRAHGGAVDAITRDTTPEYFEQDGDHITLHAYKFSTYALTYTPDAPPYNPKDKVVATTPEPDPTHAAYLQGNGDGTFAPDRVMTRAEVAQMLYNLLEDKDVEVTATFSDVTDAWYTEAVEALASLGIVQGYPDGTFRPEAEITRAEFTALLVRFLNATGEGAGFEDVPEPHWAYGEITTAAALGWVRGVGGNQFAPMRPITRAEVAVIVNRALARIPDPTTLDAEETPFTDLSPDHWAYYDILEATVPHSD